MIVINIIGGLGNQMFQYAFGYAMARQQDVILKLDVSGFETYDLRKYELGLYRINNDFASMDDLKNLKYLEENLFEKIIRILRKKALGSARSYYIEPNFAFNVDVFGLKGDIYFEGYWQSEKYFKNYRTELLHIYNLKKIINKKTESYRLEICSNESVSLHIRRGDYVTDVHSNSTHGVCDLEFYRQAVSFVKNEVSNPCFFIFSDDLCWAQENLKFIDQIVFVDTGKNTPDHEDMFLMSQCEHNIIANSSFSWWGAWLNQNPDKVVIAPKKWFKDESINTDDLIPEEWIRL